MTKNKQARPPKTHFFSKEAFQPRHDTELRWLGNSGLLINSRGYCVLVDPVLEGFDLPLLIDMPIKTEEVPQLDALLITHSDNDHFSLDTITKLLKYEPTVHSPHYVAELMKKHFDITTKGHDINETFNDGPLTIKVTPADHLWQNASTKYKRIFKLEDSCGFWIETADGTIWIPGDSKLLPEHLTMPQPDCIFFDFSDNEWHIELDNAIQLANTYPKADLLLSHWGTVDAPDMTVFNADPAALMKKVINPDRIKVLAAGEPLTLTRSQ